MSVVTKEPHARTRVAGTRLDAPTHFGADVTVNKGREDPLEVSTGRNSGRLLGHRLDVGRFVTHRFAMGDFEAAYDTFARAADTGAQPVVTTP